MELSFSDDISLIVSPTGATVTDYNGTAVPTWQMKVKNNTSGALDIGLSATQLYNQNSMQYNSWIQLGVASGATTTNGADPDTTALGYGSANYLNTYNGDIQTSNGSYYRFHTSAPTFATSPSSGNQLYVVATLERIIFPNEANKG